MPNSLSPLADPSRSVAQAMGVIEKRFESIAANLANVSTPGYKRVVTAEASFRDDLQRARLRTELSRDLTPGDLTRTGNPLELSLQGDGYLVVEDAATAESFYTRTLRARIDADGFLVDHRNLRLMGEAGPVPMPSPTAEVLIREDGTVEADGQVVDRLMVASVSGGGSLDDAGPGLYRAAPDAVLNRVEETRVRAGYREGSNVDSLHELVQMISLQRQFQATQRVLSVQSDLRTRLAQNFR